MYRKHIHHIDNDSLLQVFTCYRLEEENNWYFQFTWRNLAQVCRRWRYLMFNSPSHLDLCLLLTNDSPSAHTPSHLPPLPLVIYHSDRTRTMVRKDEDNIYLGLQQHHGRVRRVVLRAPSLSLSIWLELMNKVFPRLEVLSLFSTTAGETNLMLPETIQAPGLRSLVLHGVGLQRGLTFLSSSITLSTIALTHIGASCYFHPGQLVTQLQSLPHLEELSIGFAIPIPLPSSQGKLLPVPIPPVTLPALRQLTFRGVDIYLDNLVAQINTPLLERFSLTLLFDLTFTLVNLTEFIHRNKGFECLVARVTFNKDGASIDIGRLNLRVNCESLDWQIDSATQVCSTLRKVLSIIEELTVDLDKDGMLSGWENTLDSIMWHELLLPFIRVKKLCIGTSLTLELSQALGSVTGGSVLELLPDLQELDVQLEINHAKRAFSLFLESRESVGRPVHLLVLHGLWSGTLTLQGTDTTWNERTEVHAQVTASTSNASKSDPLVSTWPNVLSLGLSGLAVSEDELYDWIRRNNPAVMQFQTTPGTDEHSFGQLVKLLRDKGCYAVAGWEIPGKGQRITNLLITPFRQGLLGVVFPTTGMPELPKPRLQLPQLDLAVHQTIINMLPAHLRSLPEPLLNQQIALFVRQHHNKTMQGGGAPLNAAALSQQQQHRVLGGGLGAGVGGGLGGGLMNTSGTNSLSGGLGPMGMGGNMGPTGIAGNNGPGAGGFRNIGLGLGVPAGGTSFGGLSTGTGLDGGGAPGGGGDGSAGGGGLGGMPHGGVTLDIYQSFIMQRNGEGGQGQ